MESISFAQKLLTALPYFIELEAEYLRDLDRARFENENTEQKTYDIIIVGAGTAGCVVANRLSAHFSVLLLEAGGDPPSAVSVPAFDVYVGKAAAINYLYKTTPQRLANNRVLNKATGKMLGGSGSHNCILYNRGHPLDYDNWSNIVGDQSWNYTNLLKYFKKSEKYAGVWPRTDQHGSRGPIRVETDPSVIDSPWKYAARKLGYKYADQNGPQKESFGPIEITRRRGRRVSTYTAYLQPILQRKTLTVARYADVQKLLFSKNRAIGVKYLRHGKFLKAFASREVILSAGTFGTPLLLFKSGIGPKAMLQRANIKLKLHLPAVGRYLQDHVGVESLQLLVNPSIVKSVQNNLTQVDFEMYFKHNKRSLLSTLLLSPQVMYVSDVAKAKKESNWPDLQIRRTYCVDEDNTYPTNQICFDVLMGRPEISRHVLGTLKLNTTAYRNGERDNVKLALIDDQILKSKRDNRALKEGLTFLKKILKTRKFRKLGQQLKADTKCEVLHKLNSVQYWNCYFSRVAIWHDHPVGTCRMGRDGNIKISVVDSRLCVHKVDGLRIIDASIMPKITNANLNTPVTTIAEKAADVILQRHMPHVL